MEATVKNNPARLLFIDDDEYVKQMVDMVFTRLGYTIHSFISSTEALKWYEKEYKVVDIIVLDMVMPELPVRDVFTQLRKINPDARIILTSGYSMNEISGVCSVPVRAGLSRNPLILHK